MRRRRRPRQQHGLVHGGPIGGQVIWPVVDEDWRLDARRLAEVDAALAAANAAGAQAGWSIRLGGFAVLYGDHDAVRDLLARLPKRKLGEREYPFQLQGHAAFHSPLLQATSQRAARELGDLQIAAPRVPLVDGRGHVWNPIAADPAALLDYTLTAQVTATFHFTGAVRVALREFAPDHLVLLGPGDTLGGAIAHVLIAESWRGIDSKAAFLERQKGDAPFLIAMARPDQSARVSAGGATGPAAS